MQQTLAQDISITGVGLHSGADVQLTLKPAAPGAGIAFHRTDVNGRDNIIPALYNRVIDTRLCTMLGNEDSVTVGTVEHLMAALRGCHIDNAVVELNGPEVPVMDGSAAPFVALIDQAGITMQDATRRRIRVLEEVSVQDSGKFARLTPSDESLFTGNIEFDHPAIGRQSRSLQLVNGNFRHDIADSRTFGFLHEVEWMRSQGLARGGSLDNAIVLDTSGVMNDSGLRSPDEFIRHKLLDAIGDLYLAGAPILGAYDGHKAGHALNNQLLRALFANEQAWEWA